MYCRICGNTNARELMVEHGYTIPRHNVICADCLRKRDDLAIQGDIDNRHGIADDLRDAGLNRRYANGGSTLPEGSELS